MKLFPLILLLVVAASPEVAGGDAAEESGGQIDPALNDIFDAWRSREETFRSFDLSFRIERTSRSSSIGALNAAGASDDAGEETLFRLRVDGARVRFEGASQPLIHIGGEPIRLASLLDETTGQGNEEYLAALWSGFEQRTTPPPTLPHILLREPERVTHFWGRRDEHYPRALIVPLDSLQGRTPAQRHSLEMPEVADAALLALRPLSLAVDPPRPGRCTLLPEHSRMGGIDCVVIEETLQEKSPEQLRRYWLDPSRDFLPLRVLDLENDVSIRHWEFEYDEAVAGIWVPSRWSVLRLRSYGGVEEFTTVVRTSWRSGEDALTDSFTLRFPPGTWIVDLERDRQLLIEEDGRTRHLKLLEAAGTATYEGLLGDKEGLLNWPRTGRVLVELVTWPWVLATLPVLWVVVHSTGVFVRRMRHSDAGQPKNAPPDEATPTSDVSDPGRPETARS